jgi:type I restriction enzyme, S subunit
VKSRWPIKKVSEIAHHSLGKMLDKAKNRGEMKPYLRNLNVRWFSFDLSDVLTMPFLPEETTKYTAVKGDVLICEGGYPGRAAIWQKDEPIFFQKALHRVRFTEPDRNKWFVYYLHAKDLDGTLKQHFNGAGIQHFTGEALAEFPIPVPPLSEQQRIVGILDKAFEAIATAQTNTEKNLQNARALFSVHLQESFSPSKNRVRAGWKTVSFFEIAKVQSGAGFPLTFQGKVKNGIPFYKVSDMNLLGNEREMVSENNSITEEVRKKLHAALFPKGSVIFPKIGGAIATNKKRLTSRACCVDNNVMGAIPDPSRVESEFLYYFFLANNLSDFANDSHLPSIKSSTIEAWRLSIPTTLIEQQRIVRGFNSLDSETQRLESIYQRKLAALEELKKSLLQQAFTGQL